MTVIVHKFGGTSVGSAERFAAVTGIVAQVEHQPVVVVSAMSGVTNQLIAGARAAAEGRDTVYREIKAELLARHLDVVDTLLTRSRERLEVGGFVEDRLHELERLYRSIAVLGEVTARGLDAVAAFGELLSAHILAAALRERDLRAEAVSATETLVTDDHFGAARPLMAQTRARLQARVKPLLERGVIPVITGYIGATESGVTTTLGRGGSDFSAAIFAAGLDADEVWIWSDVDGILTADPNLVPQARTLPELSYSEAADLAYYGADVLHPKTVGPIVSAGIPMRLRNSFNPQHPGTLVVKSPHADRQRLPAIISTDGLTLIAVGSRDDTWNLALTARALQCLSAAGVDVPMFSQSFSEHTLNLVLREQDQTHALKGLQNEFGALWGDNFVLDVKEKVATVSVVGVPGWNTRGIVSHTFAALGEHGTRVIAVAQAATEHNVSFCIPEDQMADTVRFLHRELGLE
ncbi:MAG TPA: aspartate kinase [Anaerolineae bacterium]|nr:aspartate kinase [Anaerolineae bacterium]HQK13073.1 aspartate kinase [Anaerolineae bacterium]